jgi:copper(I)-binding protein
MSLRSILVLSIVLLLAIMLACSADKGPPLLATDVEVTPAIPGMSMRAGYLTLKNNSAEDIRITHVSSPQIRSVEIHETVIENDIAKMRKVAELIIPPGETLRFERGGLHLMLTEVDNETSEVSLSLHSDDQLLLTLNTRVAENK